jgi:hypothetical protein
MVVTVILGIFRFSDNVSEAGSVPVFRWNGERAEFTQVGPVESVRPSPSSLTRYGTPATCRVETREAGFAHYAVNFTTSRESRATQS